MFPTDDALKKHEEMKFIHKFMDEYYKKFEYYPTVITRDSTIESKNSVGVMSLPVLETYFHSFLPYTYRKKLTLDQKCRKRELVELRAIYFFLARSMGYKLTDIGCHFHNMHHTTVLNGLKLFRNLYETEEKFRVLYYNIVNYIKKHKEDELRALESPSEMEN